MDEAYLNGVTLATLFRIVEDDVCRPLSIEDILPEFRKRRPKMPRGKTIRFDVQIRPAVKQELKQRAKAAGFSLAEYAVRKLEAGLICAFDRRMRIHTIFLRDIDPECDKIVDRIAYHVNGALEKSQNSKDGRLSHEERAELVNGLIRITRAHEEIHRLP